VFSGFLAQILIREISGEAQGARKKERERFRARQANGVHMAIQFDLIDRNEKEKYFHSQKEKDERKKLKYVLYGSQQ